MIREVEIRNFKCFQCLRLKGLSRVNIVGGANNVGKTAILEALFLFHDRRSPGMFLAPFARRGLDVIRLDAECVWAPYFHGLDLRRPIEIDLAGDGPARSARYEFDQAYVPPQRNGASSSSSEAHISTQEGGLGPGGVRITYADGDGKASVVHSYIEGNQLRLDPTEPVAKVTRAFFLPSTGAGADADRFSTAKENKRGAVVEDFLKLMNPEVRDLHVSTAMGKPTVYCDVGLPKAVPLAYTGAGLCRLLSIIAPMAASPGALVLIDEVENGIHHSVQERFWRALGEAAMRLDCQIVATTHSQECLEAAHAAFGAELFEPEFRYVRLERIDDQTTAKVLNHVMLGAASSANLEVR
jgi:hypothetical protein